MNAFVFQAAMLCEDCGTQTRAELDASEPRHGTTPEGMSAFLGFDPEDEESYDSDDYPKGPYSDGGGEADTPQHCDKCGVLLENPLTSDGEAYVIEAFGDFIVRNDGDKAVINVWRNYYAYLLDRVDFLGLFDEKLAGDQAFDAPEVWADALRDDEIRYLDQQTDATLQGDD